MSRVRCAIWRWRFESADPVVIDDAERADPRRRQIKDERAAETTCADHQHAGGPEPRLPGAAHFAQHDVPRIAFKVFVGKSHQVS